MRYSHVCQTWCAIAVLSLPARAMKLASPYNTLTQPITTYGGGGEGQDGRNGEDGDRRCESNESNVARVLHSKWPETISSGPIETN